jgi:hypothetical protein
MSLFVRSLTRGEGNHIQRILRHGKSRTPFRRAQVIIHSAHGYTVQEIAKVTCLHEEYIRELIRRFNKEGVDLFKERARTGRPVELVPEIRSESWLNRIEAEFTEPKEFVLSNSNYPSHQQMQREWNAFIRYRNKRNSKNKKT